MTTILMEFCLLHVYFLVYKAQRFKNDNTGNCWIILYLEKILAGMFRNIQNVSKYIRIYFNLINQLMRRHIWLFVKYNFNFQH